MEVIARPRRTGKTFELINRALKNQNTILLVHDRVKAKVIMKSYPLLAERVFSWDEYKIKQYGYQPGSQPKEIYIDDLRFLLNDMFPYQLIKGIGVTCEEPVEKGLKATIKKILNDIQQVKNEGKDGIQKNTI